MAKLNLTPSEFADLVAAFILDKMVNPDEIIIENEDFTKLINRISSQGAKPLFTKYYLDMKADERLSYKRLKTTLEPGATTMSMIEVKPEKAKVAGSGLTNFAKKAIKMLLLQGGKTEEEVDMLLEKYEEEILNG